MIRPCHKHHILLLVFTTLVAARAAKPSLIEQTCKASSNTDPNIKYNVCVNALQAAPASQCANLTRLGLISLRLARDNTSDTRCYIKRLMMRNTTRYSSSTIAIQAKAALSDCYELYSDSIPTLKDVTKDYKAKRFLDANIKVSSVIDASVTCENGFKEVDGASPLTKRNNVTFQLAAMTLSIMNMIQS